MSIIFFVGKSILITVSKKMFQNPVLNIIQAIYFNGYNNVTNTDQRII